MQLKRTGCSEGAACSIWKIWALLTKQTDAIINPSIQTSQQTRLVLVTFPERRAEEPAQLR